ncbi:MAG: hypothetical protein AAGG72_07805, partial [Pseudomonadota bacterium]
DAKDGLLLKAAASVIGWTAHFPALNSAWCEGWNRSKISGRFHGRRKGSLCHSRSGYAVDALAEGLRQCDRRKMIV